MLMITVKNNKLKTTKPKIYAIYRKKSSMIKVIAFLGCMISCPSVSAALSPGFNILTGPVDINKSVNFTDHQYAGFTNKSGYVTMTTTLSEYYANGFVFGGVVLTSSGSTGTNSNINTCKTVAYPIVTIDGYNGYQVAPGIVVVAYGSLQGSSQSQGINVTGSTNFTGTFVGTPVNISASSSWDSSGKLTSGTATTGCPMSLAASAGTLPSGNGGVFSGNKPTTSLLSESVSGKINYGVYIKPGSPAFVGSFNAIFATGINDTSSRVIVPIDINWPGVVCNINTPSSISFGDVVATQLEPINVAANFSISCDGSGSVTPVTYSFISGATGGTRTTIALKNSDGSTSGSVRGFINDSTTPTIMCADSGETIPFDGSTFSAIAPSDGSSIQRSLSWVLCPNSDASPGPASGSVTINLTY